MHQTDPHPDPYANQYPPPPPLATEHRDSGQYIPPPEQTYTPLQDLHSAPAMSMNDRHEIAAAGHHGGYVDPSFHSVPMNEPKAQYARTTTDPHAVTMDEYRQSEQHEQLYNNGNQQHGGGGYYVDYHDEPDMANSHTPMVPQSSLQPHENNYSNNRKYVGGGPMVAPEDEAAAYRPKVYQREEHGRGGCNCCCYNPAMTCCSCFCFLISLGFLAAGIALIIASKVITDKCNTKCGAAAEQAASYGVDENPCDAICGKVVHDGLLYGGIGVTALAGIAIIWKLFMWMCAAGSRR